MTFNFRRLFVVVTSLLVDFGRARCTFDRFLIVGPVGSGLVYNVEISKRFHPSSSLFTQLLIVVIVLLVLLVLLHTNKSL